MSEWRYLTRRERALRWLIRRLDDWAETIAEHEWEKHGR